MRRLYTIGRRLRGTCIVEQRAVRGSSAPLSKRIWATKFQKLAPVFPWRHAHSAKINRGHLTSCASEGESSGSEGRAAGWCGFAVRGLDRKQDELLPPSERANLHSIHASPAPSRASIRGFSARTIIPRTRYGSGFRFVSPRCPFGLDGK
jgi:hypothetical protein